jgi:MFS family permease
MTTELAMTEATLAEPAVALVPAADRTRILLYASGLLFLCGFGRPWGGLIDVPVQFFLKNRLHLSAHELAGFRLLSALPLYLSVIFGFTRDRMNPLGRRDRGFLIVFGFSTALIFAIMAFTPVSYVTMLVGVVIATSSFLLVDSAKAGILYTLGQQQVMSGQVSTVWNIVESLPFLISFLIGGALSQSLEGQRADLAARILFLVGAGIMTAIALYGLMRPKVVFDSLKDERDVSATPISDLRRLVRHWPIYPALLIWFLWDFAPGTQTVMQYYISNTLHASDAIWGDYNAIFVAGFIPTFLLYGYLCRRVSLKTLLFWGTVVGAPQMIPLLFVHSPASVLVAAAVLGLMGGVCSAAYWDLIIRSCPKGLQATMFGLTTAVYWIAARFGDLWGTDLYDHHGGFVVCVWVTTAVYALILPALWLVPRRLAATADGEVAETATGA